MSRKGDSQKGNAEPAQQATQIQFTSTEMDVIDDRCTEPWKFKLVWWYLHSYARRTKVERTLTLTQYYYDGKLHREDGPAVEYATGTKEWWQHGLQHRLDGPAVELSNGDKVWWQDGKIHRLDGPAVECANGTKAWRQHGKLHREDGPAVEWADGDKEWWQHGKRLQ